MCYNETPMRGNKMNDKRDMMIAVLIVGIAPIAVTAIGTKIMNRKFRKSLEK